MNADTNPHVAPPMIDLRATTPGTLIVLGREVLVVNALGLTLPVGQIPQFDQPEPPEILTPGPTGPPPQPSPDRVEQPPQRRSRREDDSRPFRSLLKLLGEVDKEKRDSPYECTKRSASDGWRSQRQGSFCDNCRGSSQDKEKPRLRVIIPRDDEDQRDDRLYK